MATVMTFVLGANTAFNKSVLRNQMLQGDAYTDNWLSAIRHTPKLARRMIVGTMSLVAQLYPDKTHVVYAYEQATSRRNSQ